MLFLDPEFPSKKGEGSPLITKNEDPKQEMLRTKQDEGYGPGNVVLADTQENHGPEKEDPLNPDWTIETENGSVSLFKPN